MQRFFGLLYYGQRPLQGLNFYQIRRYYRHRYMRCFHRHLSGYGVWLDKRAK